MHQLVSWFGSIAVNKVLDGQVTKGFNLLEPEMKKLLTHEALVSRVNVIINVQRKHVWRALKKLSSHDDANLLVWFLWNVDENIDLRQLLELCDHYGTDKVRQLYIDGIAPNLMGVYLDNELDSNIYGGLSQ